MKQEKTFSIAFYLYFWYFYLIFLQLLSSTQTQEITAEILQLIHESDLPEEVKEKVYAEVPKMSEEKQQQLLEKLEKAEKKYQKKLHSALDDMENTSFGIVRKAQVYVGKIRENAATITDKEEIENIENLLDEL